MRKLWKKQIVTMMNLNNLLVLLLQKKYGIKTMTKNREQKN